MSGWRTETAEDLAEAAKNLEAAMSGPPGEMGEERFRQAWVAYVLIEKSIAFVKVDVGEENPGKFVKLKRYSVPDERQALQFAVKYLRKGSEDFSLGDFFQALKGLRESRNYLRALIRRKRLERFRKARAR